MTLGALGVLVVDLDQTGPFSDSCTRKGETPMEKVWDVVCGMQGDTVKWKSRSDYKGKAYYFCCDGCKGAFERSPDYHLQNFKEEHPGVEPSPSGPVV